MKYDYLWVHQEWLTIGKRCLTLKSCYHTNYHLALVHKFPSYYSNFLNVLGHLKAGGIEQLSSRYSFPAIKPATLRPHRQPRLHFHRLLLPEQQKLEKTTSNLKKLVWLKIGSSWRTFNLIKTLNGFIFFPMAGTLAGWLAGVSMKNNLGSGLEHYSSLFLPSSVLKTATWAGALV